MAIWQELGFSGNPYDSRPLRATQEGDRLMIGRDMESHTLRSQIENTTLHPTLEGANGVGKTSLVLVNAYRLMEERKMNVDAPTWLPIDKILQVHTDADRLYRDALMAVGQALISHEAFLADCGIATANLDAVRDWLNNPLIQGGGGGFQILGNGVNADVSREANTGDGFVASGLEELVKAALLQTFPDESDGGLIGIIDNVELLGRSNEARSVLERVRDTVLEIPRVRWVLCGALGIVRSAVTSPRLEGRVGTPIEILPVADDWIEPLVAARIQHYALRDDATPTLDPSAFRHLYDVCNHNLRDALKYAQSFSVWLDVESHIGEPDSFREYLEIWLAEEADKIVRAISLQPRAWRFFDDLAAAGGTCAPSDNAVFGFNTAQQMRTNFVALERASLVKAEIDEDDLRRRTVNLTDKGWVVNYARRGFE